MSNIRHVAAALALAASVIACNGSNTVHISAERADMNDYALDVADGHFVSLVYTSTQKDGAAKKGAMYRIYLSDGPLDGVKPATDKAMLYLSVAGAEGSGDEPLPVGGYPAVADPFSKDTFGKTHELEITPPNGGDKVRLSAMQGSIEITKSDAAELAGTIDLQKDDVVVKGAFSVKKRP